MFPQRLFGFLIAMPYLLTIVDCGSELSEIFKDDFYSDKLDITNTHKCKILPLLNQIPVEELGTIAKNVSSGYVYDKLITSKPGKKYLLLICGFHQLPDQGDVEITERAVAEFNRSKIIPEHFTKDKWVYVKYATFALLPLSNIHLAVVCVSIQSKKGLSTKWGYTEMQRNLRRVLLPLDIWIEHLLPNAEQEAAALKSFSNLQRDELETILEEVKNGNVFDFLASWIVTTEQIPKPKYLHICCGGLKTKFTSSDIMKHAIQEFKKFRNGLRHIIEPTKLQYIEYVSLAEVLEKTFAGNLRIVILSVAFSPEVNTDVGWVLPENERALRNILGAAGIQLIDILPTVEQEKEALYSLESLPRDEIYRIFSQTKSGEPHDILVPTQHKIGKFLHICVAVNYRGEVAKRRRMAIHMFQNSEIFKYYIPKAGVQYIRHVAFVEPFMNLMPKSDSSQIFAFSISIKNEGVEKIKWGFTKVEQIQMKLAISAEIPVEKAMPCREDVDAAQRALTSLSKTDISKIVAEAEDGYPYEILLIAVDGNPLTNLLLICYVLLGRDIIDNETVLCSAFEKFTKMKALPNYVTKEKREYVKYIAMVQQDVILETDENAMIVAICVAMNPDGIEKASWDYTKNERILNKIIKDGALPREKLTSNITQTTMATCSFGAINHEKVVELCEETINGWYDVVVPSRQFPQENLTCPKFLHIALAMSIESPTDYTEAKKSAIRTFGHIQPISEFFTKAERKSIEFVEFVEYPFTRETQTYWIFSVSIATNLEEVGYTEAERNMRKLFGYDEPRQNLHVTGDLANEAAKELLRMTVDSIIEDCTDFEKLGIDQRNGEFLTNALMVDNMVTHFQVYCVVQATERDEALRKGINTLKQERVVEKYFKSKSNYISRQTIVDCSLHNGFHIIGLHANLKTFAGNTLPVWYFVKKMKTATNLELMSEMLQEIFSRVLNFPKEKLTLNSEPPVQEALECAHQLLPKLPEIYMEMKKPAKTRQIVQGKYVVGEGSNPTYLQFYFVADNLANDSMARDVAVDAIKKQVMDHLHQLINKPILYVTLAETEFLPKKSQVGYVIEKPFSLVILHFAMKQSKPGSWRYAVRQPEAQRRALA